MHSPRLRNLVSRLKLIYSDNASRSYTAPSKTFSSGLYDETCLGVDEIFGRAPVRRNASEVI